MLREYLSADAFKSGIVQYLQKYSYKNTRNEDLWNSMASVSMFVCISTFGIDSLFCTLPAPPRTPQHHHAALHHINPSEKNHKCFL